MKNTVLSASIDFLIRLNYRGDAAVYRQNCGKGDLTLIVPGAALKAEPLPPSSVRTTSKADKNRGECLIFVYRPLFLRSNAASAASKTVQATAALYFRI